MTETVPKNGEFLDGKLWFHRVGSVVTVGLTDSAIEEVGSVEAIDFPGEGENFDSGAVILTLDGTHGKLDVIAPADGVIQEVNEALKEEPDMMLEDPLEEGWLFKFEIEDLSQLIELETRQAS